MATQLLSPGTMADSDVVGTVVWSNPDNAKISDDVYATFTTGDSDTTSHYLKATNFGFSIPAGATINGIVVDVDRKGDAGPSSQDAYVNIVKSDGTFGSTNKADAVTIWPTIEATATYGASNDLWGETWTVADINNSNFGVGISCHGARDNDYVDHIRITVSYTVVGPFPSHFITGRTPSAP